MPFKVFVTNDAARDLEGIYQYVASHDSPEKANGVLAQIEKSCLNLNESPHRGAYPKELLNLGIREYRQIYFKPYRIIYRVSGDNVYILLIADGRRDFQTLLQRRLIES